MVCAHLEMEVVCDGYYVRVIVCSSCRLRVQFNREDPSYPWFPVGLKPRPDQRKASEVDVRARVPCWVKE